jgi:hypothetical protein
VESVRSFSVLEGRSDLHVAGHRGGTIRRLPSSVTGGLCAGGVCSPADPLHGEGGTGRREPASMFVVPSLLEDDGLGRSEARDAPVLACEQGVHTMGGTGRHVPAHGIDVNFESSMDALPQPAVVTQRLDLWKVELDQDFDKSFLLAGLEYGFMIIDTECTLHDSFRSNYKSVLLDDRVKVEVQIRKEIDLGRYIVVKNPPSVISSLGAVPKPGGKVRVIHDLSRPDGGINRFCENSSVTYSTIEEAISFMAPNCFMAKIDLSVLI